MKTSQDKVILFLLFLFLFYLFIFYNFFNDNANINNNNTNTNNNINNNNCPGSFNISNVKQVSYEPRVFVHSNFLSDEECDIIINYGIKKLEPSEVVSEGGKASLSQFRTSYGTFLDTNDFLQSIYERISEWTQIHPSHSEPFYLLRYEKGQEYKPHYDFFNKDVEGVEAFIGAPGQRLATVLLYLETPNKGGETIFPYGDISVPAIKGTAVLFYSMTVDHELDQTSLHGGSSVEDGTKYCATVWIRENRWSIYG